MIKGQTVFDFAKSEYVMTYKFRCGSKLKTRWYTLDRYDRQWWWDSPTEPTLAPTILSTWSK